MTDITVESTSPPATAAPWFGRPWEHRQAAIAGVGSLGACTAYWATARLFAPDAAPGWIEFLGTATSLWSVWITQRRNVLALPVGIVSVVLMGWFFADVGLVGQQWLQWGYYLPVAVLGVGALDPRRRGPDRAHRHPAALDIAGLAVVVAAVAATLVLGWLLDAGWDDALYTYWDASIVAASVLAMLLMSWKKVESWWLWLFPVNLSAIGLYVATGAYMFAALYVLFLLMAVVGLLRWRSAAEQALA